MAAAGKSSDNSDKDKSEEAIETTVESIAEQIPSVNEWIPEQLVPAWELVSAHPWIGALVIIAAFYLLALLLRTTVFSILHRAVSITQSKADDVILNHIKKPVFTTVFFFGITVAIEVAKLPAALTLNKILLSVIIISWMRAFLHITNAALDALAEPNSRFTLVEPRTVPMFDLTSKLLLILIGSYVLLMVWGINPVGWLASAGIVGIAVGFAAKDTLANLFSGFFIVADAPYKIGDYINLDSGERGRVSAIGLRSTRLQTRDDVEITIPNGVIANAKIINECGGPSTKMRIRVPVGVAYGPDTDQVCDLLQTIGVEHQGTSSYPEPRVRMRAFGPSSLDFELMCWIDQPEDRGRTIHLLLIQIYKTFNEHNIEIPFSKQDLYIKEFPGQSLD